MALPFEMDQSWPRMTQHTRALSRYLQYVGKHSAENRACIARKWTQATMASLSNI